MNIAKRIYELMKRKDWTAYELSKQTGISTNTIYAWENNSMPTLTNVIKVCEAMNITLEQFFCGEANYRLSDDEQKFLNEWFALADTQKNAILTLINNYVLLHNKK